MGHRVGLKVRQDAAECCISDRQRRLSTPLARGAAGLGPPGAEDGPDGRPIAFDIDEADGVIERE